MPTNQTVWNAILTVVGAALLAALGFLYNEVAELKEKQAGTTATRFTDKNASELRSDITLTLTGIDKRIAIMENNNDWIRQWVMSAHSNPTPGHGEEKSEPAPAPAPASAPVPKVSPSNNSPRYDLRQQQKK